MNCKDIQSQLDDFLDRQLSSEVEAVMAGHLDSCSDCRQALDETRAIRRALRDLPLVPASDDFEGNVFAAVRRQYSKTDKQPAHHRPHRHFVAGFATAVAASLALWFASTVFMPQLENGGQQVQLVELAVQQTRTVNLVFDAPRDLANVTLRIDLPENVELEGFSGQRQLVWQTALKKGQNVLALPVIAIGNGEGRLVARLNYDGKSKQFDIVLKAGGAGTGYYPAVETADEIQV